MAQGKMKIKAKVPDKAKKQAPKKKAAICKRANRPNQPKKTKGQEQAKIKQAITKMVNKAVEDEMRTRATSCNAPTSKAQKVVAEYNSKR